MALFFLSPSAFVAFPTRSSTAAPGGRLKLAPWIPCLHPSASSSSAISAPFYSLSAATATAGNLQAPPPLLQSSDVGGSGDRSEFYLNLGMAVRTLREDMPAIFSKDLNYEIYRDDITFLDPMNTFRGIEKYRLIFWALRFHGKILFREIGLEVLRIWQPSDDTILIRWKLWGVPRVPWEARGQFQGTSRYKLDRKGKIYEHKVDNLAFNFPRVAIRPNTVLDVVAAAPSPVCTNLTFVQEGSLSDGLFSFSWVEFYWAVVETVGQEENSVIRGHERLLSVPCL